MRASPVLVALAALVVPTAAAGPTQVHVSQVDGSLVVQWALAGDTRSLPNGSLEYGATAMRGSAVEAEMVGYVDASPYVGFSGADIQRDLEEAAATLYRASVPAQGARVHYRVVDGAGSASVAYEARTLPGPADPVRFVVYADQGTLEDGTIGPPAYRPWEMVNASLAEDPDLVLVAGDLSYAKEAKLRWWNHWFDLIEPLAATRPYYAAVGNHDRDFVTGYDQWRARFSFERDEQNYAFDAGPVHVLVLNSQEACLEGELTERVQRVNPMCSVSTPTGAPLANTEILDFMRADLADARARGVPWIVVAFHHPPYAHGGYNESNSGSAYMWWLREHWIPIFEEHGVDLVLTGHDHSYARSWPMIANATTATSGVSFQEGEGIVYVVTGGGGRNPYTLSAGTPWWLATAARAHHITIVDADVHALRVVVRDHAGETLDAFEIVRRAASQHAFPAWLALAALGGLVARRSTQR